MHSKAREMKKLEDEVKNQGMTKTRYWEKTAGGDIYNSPPVMGADTSDRVLFTGTLKEVKDMRKIIGGYEAYIRVQEKIKGYDFTPRKLDSDLIDAFEKHRRKKTKTVFHEDVDTFWSAFFGEINYLDKPVTTPCALIGTGYMTKYNLFSKRENVSVGKRLKKIASEWDIPFYKVESWDAPKSF